MKAQYWLVKQEPEDYSWDNLVMDAKTSWTGVRNYLARNHLRLMKQGDQVLFYHSGKEKQIVGICKVAREFYQDPTTKEIEWVCVDLEPKKKLKNPVTLTSIKATPLLKQMQFVRQSRLSVSQLTREEFQAVVKLSEGK